MLPHPFDNCKRWGHPNADKDPIYDGRYLFHEWFHAVEDKFDLPKGEGWDATHAVLELADAYLYKNVLFGKKDYSNGHPELAELRGKIKPYFEEFLLGKGTAKCFIEFREQMLKRFPT